MRRGAAALAIGLDADSEPGVDAVFGGWAEVGSGSVTRAYRSRLRVPGTPVWAEMTLEFGDDLDHATCWLHYGASDPADPMTTWTPGEVAIEVRRSGSRCAGAPRARCSQIPRSGSCSTTAGSGPRSRGVSESCRDSSFASLDDLDRLMLKSGAAGSTS